MVDLLNPGGRLVLHDIRTDTRFVEHARSHLAFAQVAALRLLRTGRPRAPRPVREAWARHCAAETYLTIDEAEDIFGRLLPGAKVFYHWLWSYSVVWDKAVMG